MSFRSHCLQSALIARAAREKARINNDNGEIHPELFNERARRRKAFVINETVSLLLTLAIVAAALLLVLVTEGVIK